MVCRLCLNDGIESINIFGEVGVELKIAGVLGKHFWFQPKEDDPISTDICHSCWMNVANFHEFYEDVEKCHRLLEHSYFKFDTADCKRESYDDSEIKVYIDSSENACLMSESNEPVDLGNYATQLENPYDGPLIVSAIENTKLSDKKEDLVGGLRESLRRPQRKSEVATTSVVKPQLPLSKKKAPATPNVGYGVVKRKRGRPRKSPNDSIPLKDSNSWKTKMSANDAKIAAFLKLYCDICNVEQENFTSLKSHMRQQHQCGVYVMCCNRKFTNRGHLVDHVCVHLNPEHFKCDECDKVFLNRVSVGYHKLTKHQSEEKKIFQCTQCPKKYVTAYLLQKHCIRHGERKHACDKCGNRFPSQSLLTAHIKAVHGHYDRICEICAKVIRGKTAFARHQLEHSGVALPKVQCDICGSLNKDKYSLQKHMRLHNRDGTGHLCPECGKVTADTAALRSHQRNVHEAKRKYECSVCQKAFKKLINLREHMTTHTGEYLYSCPHCPKTFKSNANMHSHRKKKHPIEFELNRTKRRVHNVEWMAKNNMLLPENIQWNTDKHINDTDRLDAIVTAIGFDDIEKF